LVSDYEVTGSAITSYTFSGLNGDVDQEYRLITKWVNGYNGANACFLNFNSDFGSNYGYQYLYGGNTTVAAGRNAVAYQLLCDVTALNNIGFGETIIYAKSGYVRTSITKMCNGVNGTTVDNVRIEGQSWNNTADNITSITVTPSGASLGVGTHLLLFKRNLIGADATSGTPTGTLNVQGKVTAGEFQKIYQNTLAAAATSVTIPGLDGNTDVLYEVRARVVNGYNGTMGCGSKLNNDTAYGGQLLYGTNTTVGALRGALSMITDFQSSGALGSAYQFQTLVYAKSGYVRTAIHESVNGIATTTVDNINITGVSWNNTADNITSIVVLSDIASGLGIGTHIELWSLRRKV